MESFRFRYAVFTIQVDLTEDRIETRGGMRSQVAPLARLEHLHVRRDKRSDQQELLLAWRTAQGKLKRLRLFSDLGEAGFDGLVAALVARRPEIDRRSVSAEEAWRLSGSRSLDWVVLPAVMAVGWIALALMLLPMLRHGLDDGQATVPVESLGVGAPPTTRNLVVLGRPLLDHSLTGEARKGELPVVWVPLVPEGWQPTDPVGAVLEVRNLTDPSAFGEKRSFSAVMRDIGFEGLSAKRQRALEERGVKLATSVKLLEYGADRRHDLFLVVMVLGGLGLATLGVFWMLWSRRVKKPA